ncbi:hypothetical protein LLE49_16755 [Alicyclobacillus tolerans]|uniref:hypothetical protein n=1 Tax=Alicyclobacillus tolerans TaxID=90970 RepID=UPI001F28FAD0|nr:hypothetical protein [Alicyclobacillus tolerans]MCF8566374.1 hypothetical protein [Alicyclobacillus tolerans]
MHLILKLALIAVTAVVFTLFIVHRPGAEQTRYSKFAIAGMLFVGAVIGVVFLLTQSLYVTSAA